MYMGFFDISPFVDKNSERLMLSKRIGAIEKELRSKFLITDQMDGGAFEISDGQAPADHLNDGEWHDFAPSQSLWGGKEAYCRFRQVITVPDRMKGKDIFYTVSAAEDGAWSHTTNPQFILYVNGVLLSGMDENHAEIRILKEAKGGEKLKIHLCAYSDDYTYRGRMFLSSRIFTRDEQVLRLSYHLRTIRDTANLFGADDAPRVEMISKLTEALRNLDLSLPYGSDFLATVKATNRAIEETILGSNPANAVVSAIGHTHIDVAWLWRLRQTREKAVRSFASMNYLMHEYADFRFISSQAQLYDFVKKDAPALFEEIKKRVREGRWEVEGGMWVEADTNIPCGESLIRQFLVGKRYFRREFDKNCEILWLPDVFGYSGALPQIMAGCGIKYFMTTKISWNEYNKIPYDTFLWEGIDGTKILTHFSPSQGYGSEGSGEFMTTYNSDLSPSQVMGGWQRYSNKDLNNNILNSYGFGDGGGGPTETMIEEGLRMRAGIPGCPKVQFEFAGDFFHRLEKEVAGSRYLNKWRGELYLEYHRGTLTAEAENKKWNRKSELLYQNIEIVNVLASLLLDNGFDRYPKTGIDNGWELILLNQFHDIIPGSSIAPVYEDSRKQYKKLITDGQYMQSTALERIANATEMNRAAVTVFNTLGFSRGGTVILPHTPPQGQSYFDENGKELPAQKTWDDQWIIAFDHVPAKGYRVFPLGISTQNANAEKTADINGNRVQTDSYLFDFSDDMEITRLYCKKIGREVIPKGKVFNRLIAFEEMPYQDNNWNTNAYFEEKSEIVSHVINARVLENGPVRAVLLISRAYHNSIIKQYLTLYKNSERIDIVNEIDWKEDCTILKAEFPVDVNTDKATYDIQFGNLERPTHSNTLADFAKFEASAQKWADMSDNSFGVSILNDCKYGYNIKDGKIRLSLLRSQNCPQEKQDQKKHIFTYSIYPHAGFVADSDTVRHALCLNVPLIGVEATGRGSLPTNFSLLACDRDNIIIETIKKAEDSDDVIVRLYETWNKKTDCRLCSDLLIHEAAQCDMMEEHDSKLDIADNTIALSFRPFEIKTLKLRFQ